MRKVTITERRVYHKVADIEIEVPDIITMALHGPDRAWMLGVHCLVYEIIIIR